MKTKYSNTTDPTNDRVLNLQQRYQLDKHDFSHKLLKIDLSANYIESLPSELGGLKQLRILHLHFNLIKRDNFSTLFRSSQLNYLTLFNNPVASQSGIRSTMISKIPSLWALDFNAIADEERNENIILNEGSIFRMLSPNSKIQWPIVLRSDNEHLSCNQLFWMEINIIRQTFVRASFILIIQKTFRGYKVRNSKNKIFTAISKVDKQIIDIVRHWKQYTINRRETHKILVEQCKSQFIRLLHIYRAYKKKKLNDYMSNNASKIIFRAIKRNNDSMQNFYSHVQKQGSSKFYFSKHQISLFITLLDQTQQYIHNNKNFKNRNLVDGMIQFVKMSSFSTIAEANTTRYLHLSDMKAIRITDQNNKFKYKNIMLLLLQPARHLKVLFNFKRQQALSRKQELIQKQSQNSFFNQLAPTTRKQNPVELEMEQKELYDLEITLLKQENSLFLIKYQHDIKVKQLKTDQKVFRSYYNLSININRFDATFKAKFEDTKRKVDKFQQNEYQQLMVAYFPYKILFQSFLKIIYLHNRSAMNDSKKEQFHLYFDQQVVFMNAVLKIQKTFRGMQDVRKNGCNLDAIMIQINQKRAVMLIQRWLRRLKENHRNQFFKEIAFRASLITTKNLYLSQEIYANLTEISKSNLYRLRFLEQMHNIYTDSTYKIVRLQLKEVTFLTNQSNNSVRGKIFKKNTNKLLQEFVPYRKNNILPEWLINQICNVPLHQDEIDIQSLQNVDQFGQDKQVAFQDLSRHYQKTQSMTRVNLKTIDEKSQEQGDIFHIIHTGASYEWAVIDRKQYMCLHYESVQEARYRMISLALHSYRFNMNGCFLWMFGDEIWESLKLYPSRTNSILDDYSIKLKQVFNIQIKEQEIPFKFNQNLRPKLFLFTAFSSQYHKSPLDIDSVTATLYAQNQDSKKVQKIEGQIFYMKSPTLFIFDPQQIQEVKKVTQNQEVQSCDLEKWYQSSSQNIIDQAFNTPLSSDNTTFISQFSQKFSILQLNKKSQLPQLMDYQSINDSKKKSKLSTNGIKILDSSNSIYQSDEKEQIILNKKDLQLYSDDNTNIPSSYSKLQQSIMVDNSTQDMLIQVFKRPVQKNLQQQMEKQLLKEIRQTDKIIYLEKIKDQCLKERLFASQQIAENQESKIQHNRQVIQQIKLDRINNRSIDEQLFQNKFGIAANFIIKQDRVFNSKKMAQDQVNNSFISPREGNGRNFRNFKQFSNDSSNKCCQRPSSILLNESMNINSEKQQKPSKLNDSVQVSYLAVDQSLPLISEQRNFNYLPKSSRTMMFNRFHPSYLHKYRHSVFPEEFFAIGQDKNNNFPFDL